MLPTTSILSTALSNMNTANEPQYETAADWCEISSPPPQELARSMEEEEVIYSTPCEDEGNYGPIYCEPPCDEYNIYEEFEGKKFHKIYHKEIWLVSYIISMINLHIAAKRLYNYCSVPG